MSGLAKVFGVDQRHCHFWARVTRPARPRIQACAIEALAIDTPAGGWFALVESPEPVDWTRVTIRPVDGGATLPVVWSSDGTRAFLFNGSPASCFADGSHAVRVSFDRGGPTAPDLDPLYSGGELAHATEDISGISAGRNA